MVPPVAPFDEVSIWPLPGPKLIMGPLAIPCMLTNLSLVAADLKTVFTGSFLSDYSFSLTQLFCMSIICPVFISFYSKFAAVLISY